RRGMDHWTVLSPDGRVLAVEEGQRRSKRGNDYVRGRSGCVEPAHRPGGEFTPHFGRGLRIIASCFLIDSGWLILHQGKLHAELVPGFLFDQNQRVLS